MDQDSLVHLFENSVNKFSKNVLFWEKKQEKYLAMTYQSAFSRVRDLAAGLLGCGLQKGDRVAILSEGRNDWVISELAIFYCRAISVPLSVRIEQPSDLAFRLQHSGCKAVIVSGKQQKKLYSVIRNIKAIEFVVLLDKDAEESATGIIQKEYYVEDLVAGGSVFNEKHPEVIEKAKNAIILEDYANICYTSGTTADPKGIILTHLNYLRNVQQASQMFDVPPDYTSLHILPWDHSFAHTVGIYTMIRNGASIASLKQGRTQNETLRNIPVCIKQIKPHFLLSVPALTKNFKKNIETSIRQKGIIIKLVFDLGLKIAIAYNREGENRGEGIVRFLKPFYRVFDAVVFSKIRESFGGRLKFLVGGGALLDIELQKFFYAIGIPVYQGYGLTEASPVISSNTPDFHRLGSSGKVVPLLDLKICDENGTELSIGQKGEIVVKGDNVMAGYWNNKAATDHSIRKGWLYTGDLGYIDADGYLYVLGRTKSLLIADDGEKFSPESIEESIVEKCPLIGQIMLYNNQKPYTVALVVLNKVKALSFLERHRLSAGSLHGQKALIKKVQQEIGNFLPGGEFQHIFPKRWLPSAFAILEEPFAESNGLMNSTMKVIRSAIVARYQPRIDLLYTPHGKDIFNEVNFMAVSKLKEPETADIN
jgi:long-chain acyl-CoA synthetase